MLDILMWVLTVEVLGLACLPLLRAFFDNRRDAALLSRPVGLVLVAYLGWALSLPKGLGFGRGTLLLALVLLGAASFLVRRSARRAGGPAAAPQPFWGSEEKRAALLFWAPTAVFMVIRAAVPEVLGAEKFMDLAFFNSLTRSGAMPPADPWMSGNTINYYYWGYLLAAALAKISAVPTFVSYNLAVATFAGYSFVAAACLALRLSGGRFAAGVWAGIGAVFAGNLTGAFDAWHAPFTRDFDYWHASRVIASGKTINEFPFFTFFHADLHPHLLVFPFFIAAFALAHRWIERGKHLEPGQAWTARGVAPAAASDLLLALTAGTSVAANKWTLPAIGILLVFAGIFRTTQGRRLPELDEGVLGAVTGGAVCAVALLLFRVYEISYDLPNRGTARTTMSSGLLEFLAMWGTLFAVSLLALWPRSPDDLKASERFALGAVAVVAGSFLLGLLLRPAVPVLTVVLPLALLAGRYGWKALRRADADGS